MPHGSHSHLAEGWPHDHGGERIGPLLTRLRLERGQSQQRLAQLLCAVSGTVTVTRHEISRWERGDRIPGTHWLGWLAAVFEVPLELLETAVANARHPHLAGTTSSTPPRLPAAALIIGCRALGTDRSDPADPGVLSARLAVLRRMDDLVGGVDLAPVALSEWRATASALAGPSFATRSFGAGALDPTIIRAAAAADATRSGFAELAQLTSWVLADAGSTAASARLGRAGLLAAHAAADRPLIAHLLGCMAEAAAETGDTGTSLRLARSATRQAAGVHPAAHALSLYRFAYVAALAGRRSEGENALLAADRIDARSLPPTDPPWLYWLDELHLTMLTGRCYAALGRPRLARSLLTEALGTGVLRPRARSLCGAWLGLANLGAGNIDWACEAAAHALIAAIRSGSLRAARWIRTLDLTLRRDPDHPAVRHYIALADTAAAYLPAASARFGTEANDRDCDRLASSG